MIFVGTLLTNKLLFFWGHPPPLLKMLKTEKKIENGIMDCTQTTSQNEQET